MKQYLLGVGLFLCGAFSLNGQQGLRSMVREQSQLAAELNHAQEGYQLTNFGQIIDYHSTRDDCAQALIVRATDGNMAIQWETAPVQPLSDRQFVEFFLITGMSLQGYDLQKATPGFSLFVNDHHLAHFQNIQGESWTSEGVDGSRLIFKGFFKDLHGDIFGYTRVIVPSHWVTENNSVRMKIVGDNAQSQHWFMVFKCTDGLAWFKSKAEKDGWYALEITPKKNRFEVTLTTSNLGADRKIIVETESGYQLKLNPKSKGNQAFATGNIPKKSLEKPSVRIFSPDDPNLSIGPVLINESNQGSEIKADRLIHYQSLIDGEKVSLQMQILSSSISSDFQQISSSLMAKGAIHLMSSSHQDIAWMDSPEACVEDRDILLITPALEKLIANPGYANDMEDVLMLREYLERHPDKHKEINELILSGRLTWGASYMQPYEEMYFGEPLVRQFYLGKRWYEQQFPGAIANIYWNVDVPGRTLQMPQILAKSGVDHMIISRHDQGLFHWEAPDGSKVLTYSPGHYYNSYVHLKKGFFESVRHFAELTEFWDKMYTPEVQSPVMPVLSDADMAVPDSYFDYIETWNSVSSDEQPLPLLMHSTAGQFLKEVVATGVDFPTIRGERPAVWLYIHGPSHFEALKAGRSAGRLLPAAEKMAVFAAIATDNWDSYPEESLQTAWESAIYPDHGWGGNQGEITDQTFLNKFVEADQIAKEQLMIAVNTISSQIRHQKKGIPIEVFNTLGWTRSDPVEYELEELPDQMMKSFRLFDQEGRDVSWQFIGIPSYYPSGFLRMGKICFIANQVPANGYLTLYLHPTNQQIEQFEPLSGQVKEWENTFYKIQFDSGGMIALYDKELGQNIWNTDQFRGGEAFTMHSEGNGAGEFADIQQPDMEGFDRLLQHDVSWEITENGTVFTKIEGKASFRHSNIQIVWTIYNDQKRIDVSAQLVNWDGTAFREFRLAFPVDLKQPEIYYEVPFGVVQVRKDELQQAAGERYLTPCPEVHPRGIGNWISASDATMGITLSSEVAVWDYLNPTDLLSQATLLQPVLLASRRSCHGLGPLYHQTGSHTMHFSLFTHSPGWMNGYRQALQANEPLIARRGSSDNSGSFPERYSFMQVDDPHTMISVVKKAEDSNQMVIRVYDIEGRDKQVNISTPLIIGESSRTNLLENYPVRIGSEKHSLKLAIGHNAIETVLLKVWNDK